MGGARGWRKVNWTESCGGGRRQKYGLAAAATEMKCDKGRCGASERGRLDEEEGSGGWGGEQEGE